MQTIKSSSRWIIIISYFVISTITGMIIESFAKNGVLSKMVHFTLAQLIMMLMLAIIYVFYLRRHLVRDYVIAQNIPKFFIKCLKYLGLILFVNLIVNVLLQMIGVESQAMNQVGIEQLSLSNPFLLFIIVVILAPFVEEIVFRYAIISLGTPSEKVTLILSSLFFGFVHIASALTLGQFQELWFLLVYGGLGFILGLSYIKTKTIFTPIVVHAIYNLLGFISIFLANG